MVRNVLILMLLSYLIPQLTYATQNDCTDCNQSLAPRLWVPQGDPEKDSMPLKSSHAQIMINGPIAEVVVTQVYHNDGTRPVNARYVFPGSTTAAVHNLTMQIGDRLIKATIKEKEQAKQIFQKAKQQGKRAALLKQHRPNVFMMDIANLMPGEDIELKLTYSELLVPEQGIYELVYPTVVGPRYGSDPFASTEETEWLSNPYAEDKKGGKQIAARSTLEATLESPIPIKDLTSVQHKINPKWINEKAVRVLLDVTETEPGNKDFILRFRLQDQQIISGLMTYENNDENFFLLMAQPPERVTRDQLLNREYVFVVDVSGSMHGFPLDTTKTLMQELLTGLKPTESFNILFFSGGSSVLSPRPLPATSENINQALSTMMSYRGGGGTELNAALKKAYSMPRNPDIARSIVVVTDGYISAERESYDLIASNLNSTNVFAFGIGSSVNRFLIESMAKAGAGEPFIVTSQKEVQSVGHRFRKYIDSPLLSNIRITGQDVDIFDMEPSKIPIMMAERPIIVFGKFRKNSDSGVIQLSGNTTNKDYVVDFPIDQAQSENQADLLPLLWARHRLARLSDHAGSRMNDNRSEIIELGLKYSLLSQFTSFVAVDEKVVNRTGMSDNAQQPLPLPLGVSTLAIGNRPMPEPEIIWLLLPFILWILLYPKLNRVRNA